MSYSFELKPQEHIHMGMDLDSIAWTAPRDTVPVLLEGRISLTTWQDTFDKVVERYRVVLSSAKWWMLVPCLVCCSMPKMISISRENKRGWLELVQEQAKIYRPAGIQVTLAKELYSCGAGSDRKLENETVGLRFEIGPNPHASPSAPVDGNLAAQLKQLADLHKNGALSNEEYLKAKAKLLNK